MTSSAHSSPSAASAAPRYQLSPQKIRLHIDKEGCFNPSHDEISGDKTVLLATYCPPVSLRCTYPLQPPAFGGFSLVPANKEGRAREYVLPYLELTALSDWSVLIDEGVNKWYFCNKWDFLPLVATVDFALFVHFQVLDKVSFQNRIKLNRVEYKRILLTTKVYSHTSENTGRISALIKVSNVVVNNDDYMILQRP